MSDSDFVARVFPRPATQRRSRAATRVGAAALLALALAGCKHKAEDGGAPGKAAPSSLVAPVASGVPIPPEAIQKAVNGSGRPVYSGPTATVRGVVRASGDAPSPQPIVLGKITPDCAPAREVYGTVFREGPGRALADVLVTVTGYDAYVPAKRSVEVVEANGCAWSSRTVAITYGERIQIVAKDRRAYVPDLLGSENQAQIIALPGGSGSDLYPRLPGRYLLVDSMRLFATADVLVLKYATFAVTGFDGKFEISGVPAGTVTINAFLPSTGASVERHVTLKAEQALALDFDLPFDAKEYAQRVEAAARERAAALASRAARGAPAPAASK